VRAGKSAEHRHFARHRDGLGVASLCVQRRFYPLSPIQPRKLSGLGAQTGKSMSPTSPNVHALVGGANHWRTVRNIKRFLKLAQT
jgi:hypothetical protein